MAKKKKASTKKTRGAKAAKSKSAPVTLCSQARFAITLSIAAVFAWGLFSIAKIDLNDSEPDTPAPDKAPTQNSQPRGQQTADHEYTFYSRLKDFQVDVPEFDHAANTTEADKNISYLIQAGSFKTQTQAEQRRAEMLLLGLEPNVEKNINSRNEIWYRVMLGPYSSRSTMANARSTLIGNHFDALVMQRKN